MSQQNSADANKKVLTFAFDSTTTDVMEVIPKDGCDDIDIFQALNQGARDGNDLLRHLPAPQKGCEVVGEVIAEYRECEETETTGVWYLIVDDENEEESISDEEDAAFEKANLCNQASDLQQQAVSLILNSDKYKCLQKAEILLNAAEVLLDLGDGHNSTITVYLLASKGLLWQFCGDQEKANQLFQESISKSQELLVSQTDVDTAIVKGDYAEFLVQIGYPSGKEMLGQVIEQLKQLKLEDDETRVWIDHNIASFSEALAKAN